MVAHRDLKGLRRGDDSRWLPRPGRTPQRSEASLGSLGWGSRFGPFPPIDSDHPPLRLDDARFGLIQTVLQLGGPILSQTGSCPPRRSG